MSWVTAVWSMVASACLTLALVYLLVWTQRRSQWAYLFFSVSAAGTACMSAVELWLMHAATPAQFVAGVRWLHVPMWAVFLALVGVVRVHLRAGQPWLAWTVCALRTVSLLLDFLTGQNLNYLEVTRLRPVPFLGESVSVAEGVPNPWMILGQLSLYLFAAFAADAAVTVWRRGERSKALTVGGSIVFFMLVGALHSVLYVRGGEAPFAASLCFLGIVAAMAWELSREAIRAARLTDDMRESEARYRGIIEGAIEGMFRTSASGKLLVANGALARMLGYGSVEEAMRAISSTATHVWADPRERSRYVQRVASEGAVHAHECQFKRRDGTTFWVSLSTRVVRGRDGRADCFDGFVMDISGRKQAEESLRENQLRCAMGADLAGLGFYELAEGGFVRYVDERARTICSFPADIACGETILAFWLDHIHRDDFPRMQDVHRQLSDGRRDRAFVEYRYLHPDQRETWIHHTAVVTRRNSAGQRLCEIGVMRDITEQKQAEEHLRASEALNRATFEQAAVGIAHIGADGRFLRLNDRFCTIAGYTREELTLLTFQDISHPDDMDADLVSRRRILSGEIQTYSIEKRNIRKDGSLVWIYLTVSLVRTAGGEPAHFIAIVQDVTDRKHAELESQRNRAEIAHLSRVAAMGELVASLAHELNQPLTAIQSNAQAAQRLVASGRPHLPDIREILADIVADDQRAADVIRRVRALLKKGEIERKPLDMNAVIREVLVLLHTEAVVKGVAVVTALSSGRLPVVGDRIQLQQVLLNLIANAFDAMNTLPPAARKLTVQSARQDADRVQVTVADAGCGIPAGRIDSLFEPFYTTKPEGLGMGLTICRSIMESHGGRIWAQNNAGGGATFHFTLPLAGITEH